jgi:hypothetical protein
MDDAAIDQRLARIETALVALAGEIAALRIEVANTARNVDITGLQRFVERDSRATRADFRLLTGLISGVATTVQALLAHQAHLCDRVAALETPQ